MRFASKNWDGHVRDAEQVARGARLLAVRDRILELARPAPGEVVVDFGAGTGLLALSVADDVRKVWAVDSSRAMTEYLQVKAESAELNNLRVVVASVTSVPLVDCIADLVLSNYCLHELADRDKRQALAEAFRLLRPGGRLVIGDMMFSLNPSGPRERRIISDKVLAIGRRGPSGWVRLAKNALRLATGRWEHPQRAAWWRVALEQAGFERVSVELLRHEAGIASAYRPAPDRVTRATAISTARGRAGPRHHSASAPQDHRAAAVAALGAKRSTSPLPA
jgi:ubiquinone/menaquinone biosynthesis C-methylase UbiE